MADTWGEILSRNYAAGRALADDFVTSRFQKKADALRSQYEDKAKAENKALQDYLPDLEADLRKLAADTGATRRGIANRKGEALDMSAMARIRDDVVRAGEQRAGALALSGDQAGARRERAGALYSTGERFDDGFGQQQAGSTIEATQGALNPDGTYDSKKGALGLAKVGAQYGDGQQAAAQTEMADTFRMKSAVAKATQLRNVVRTPGGFDEDQFVGLVEGIKEDLPEFKHLDLRAKDDKIYIFTNGVATGEITPDELDVMLNTYIQAPGQAIQSAVQAQIKAIEDQKARTKEVDDHVLKASLDAVKNLKAAGFSNSLAQSFVDLQKQAASGGGGGFQLKEIGEEPNTYIVESGGQKYIVKTNQPVGGAGGLLSAGGATDTVQVFDLFDNPVPPEVLNKAGLGGASMEALVKFDTQRAKEETDLNRGILGEQLQLFQSLGAAYGGSQKAISPGGGGGASVRGKAGALPPAGEVRDVIEAAAKKYGVPLEYAFALAQQESGYNPAATNSEYGATGLYQYIPGTAKQMGIDPTDPVQSADAAMRQFAERMKRGGVDEAIMAHFAGDGGGNRKEKTAAYLAEVQSRANDIRAQLSGGGGALPKSTAASSVAAADPALPAAKTPAALPRRPGVSSDSVGQQAADLRTKIAEVNRKKEALAQFDKDHGTQMGLEPGRPIKSAMTLEALNLSPDQRAVRQQLLDDIVAGEDELTSMAAGARRAAAALDRQQAAKGRGALYARYGGSADFFNRAGGASGGSQ